MDWRLTDKRVARGGVCSVHRRFMVALSEQLKDLVDSRAAASLWNSDPDLTEHMCIYVLDRILWC